MNARSLLRLLGATATVAFLFTALLTVKSILAYSRQGPAIREQIEAHYLGYAVWSLGRLALAAFLIAWVLALGGALVQTALFPAKRRPWLATFVAGGLGLGVVTAYRFAVTLVEEPGSVTATWLYDTMHLVRAWFWIEPSWLPPIGIGLSFLVAGSVLVVAWKLLRGHAVGSAAALVVLPTAVLSFVYFLGRPPSPPMQPLPHRSQPNILMIGSDTLRGDRLGVDGYPRNLTPHIDALARKGFWFSRIYVPIARTAPSMTSLLTGTWPRQHGVTTNFIPDEARKLPVPALPQILREHGYRTAAVGDWAASDLGKIEFGFDRAMTAPDQWNIKYLLSQGPKDMRLFLTLFTHNALGRLLLPQIYYAAGRPLTSDVGRQVRNLIDRWADGEKPFFILCFMATTHGPFGSEYPYYTLFSGHDYRGPSKFSMTRVYTPEDIAKRQAEGAESFDVQQIIDLYDGAVKRFDDEVGRMIRHLKNRGLLENTIVVIFSDHGTDLFERDTWGQGNTVLGDDPSNRIPLVIVDPRRKGGRKISATVSSIDFMPTLLDLVDIEPPPSSSGSRTLLPYLEGKEDRDLSALYATGAWLAKVRGMKKNHLEVPPLLQLLEIPDLESGAIALSPKGKQLIEQARDRAIREGDWKIVRIATRGGPAFILDSQGKQMPGMEPCLRRTLAKWAIKAGLEPADRTCPHGNE